LNENIVIINNKVSIPESYDKQFNDNLVVLFVGRDSGEKRPGIFIEIARKMLEINKELRFKLIGDFSNFKKDILLENVEFVDEIKEKQLLIEQYKNGDVIMITSRREGLPMVILEGMAYGMVPMSTNVGEIPSLINEENNNGILINNNQDDSKIIDDFVAELIALNSNKTRVIELSKNAYNSIKEVYSEEEYVRKYKELFFN
jgi:glycosyltransferase involved in cell wall biosynthesis